MNTELEEALLRGLYDLFGNWEMPEEERGSASVAACAAYIVETFHESGATSSQLKGFFELSLKMYEEKNLV